MRKWERLAGAALVVAGLAGSVAHAATGQVAVGEGSNWPFSSMARNPVDGLAYGMWRRSCCGTVSYNLLRWNGSNFAAVANGQFGEDGALDIPNFDSGYDYVSLAIDSAGGFHVAFSGSSGNPLSGPRGVFYAYRSAAGTSWTHSIVENFSHPNGWRNSNHPKIQVDSAGRPHIAYQYSDVSTSPRVHKVRYAYHNGTSWTLRDAFSQTGDSNEVGATDIAVDSNAKAHVIFKAEINGSGLDGVLYYANNTASAVGGAFAAPQALATGGTSAPEGNSMSIVLDGANRVHLVQQNSQGRLVYYNNVSGSFTNAWINNSLIGNLDGDSLSRRTDGTLYLTYGDGTTLKYAYLPGGTGSTWTTGTHISGGFDTANFFSGVIVDNGDFFALYDNGNSPRNLWFASGQAVSQPSVSISVSPASVSEDGATNLTYTVTRSAASASALVVNLATSGTATAGTDFTGSATSVTIAANATSATLTINPTVDGTVEADETVIVAVATGTGYSLGAPASATGTILNDDVPTATIAVSPANVAEDGVPNLVYTVTLNQASLSATSVNFTLGGTATPGTDFATVTSPLVIAAGNTSGTITVNPTADTTVEANETVAVTLNAGAGYSVGVPNGATGTILNDDLPNLTINNVSLNEGNAGTTTFTFTVSLSAPAGAGGVSFDIATANGTATAGSDYVNQSLTGQNIPAGASSYTFSVLVNGDLLNEPNETFVVNVTNVVNALVSDGQGQGTITNDDPLPSLAIADLSQPEGDSGSSNAVFAVTLSAASGQTVTVNYATANGSASSGSDYTATSGSLTFPPGITTQSVNVPILGDTTPESDETFTVNLASPTNATLGDANATGTIQNDDALPVLAIADAAVTEGNAGSATLSFTLSLDIPAPAAVGYSIATADGTASAPADYAARSLSGQSIATGQSSATFTVTVNGDTAIETDETVRVLLSAVTGATLGDGEAIGTIRTDEFRTLPVNDTGKVSCVDNSTTATGTVSPATPDPEAAGFNEQDCTRGAAAADALGVLYKQGGSSQPGRDYTKIANDGSVLPNSATLGSAPGDWACTRDNTTGLIWEVKTDDGGLRDKDHRYTWYDPDPQRNGGNAGSTGSDSCSGTLPGGLCNMLAYRTAVNALAGASRLCGASDWRLPDSIELQSLLHYGVPISDPSIDTAWFPNSISSTGGANFNGYYWSRDTGAKLPHTGWGVFFSPNYAGGYVESHDKTSLRHVRLVRGGQ